MEVLACVVAAVRGEFAPRHLLCLMPMPDSFIAATARRHNLTIATRNVADYNRPGLKVLDPTARQASAS
jgi:predicted nucleic acid-binding protein